jgi:electron transfer flavoprotein alpha subunit
MNIVVFAEPQNGELKKTAFEAVHYAHTIGGNVTALVIGNASNAGVLGKFGANKVLQVNDVNTQHFDSAVYTDAIVQVVNNENADVVILNYNSSGKAIAPRVAAKLKAGFVSGAVSLPDMSNGFTIKKNVFSGKALVSLNLTSSKKVIGIMPNSFPAQIVANDIPVIDAGISTKPSKIKFISLKKQEGGVPLPEAELVVSAGRGMKGPENWGIIEDLANALGAATACSRPVADVHWRPHHEHVGQTGVAIRPNLYIAVGISGAIQHLAGVNQSKCIVVINKDAEAPFFKAADYGIVGDAFEVVPALTAAVKKFKSH